MAEKVLMKGNEALGEAAICAGCRHFFGYPITPQTELAAYMAKKLPKIGGVFLQAESEIASINMVLGASAAGIRAMTSTSSPGISLMSEGISYMAGCDLPALLVNVQRGGPGLGGIQPSQSDYFQATKATGHGDFHLIVLAPSSVQEVVDLVFLAFELGEKYRMPAMLFSDGMLGQMMEPVELPEQGSFDPPDRPWAVTGTKKQRRHNIVNSLYLDPALLEKTNFDRFERYEKCKATEQRWEEFMTEDADIVLVAYGASSRICRSAVVSARAEGIKVGLLRPITLWPFVTQPLDRLSSTAKAFISVEMSMGQMAEDISLAVNGRKPVHFYGRTGGIIPSPAEVIEQIRIVNGGLKK